MYFMSLPVSLLFYYYTPIYVQIFKGIYIPPKILYAVIFFCMPDDRTIWLPLIFFFKDADSMEICSVISMVNVEWWIGKKLEANGPDLTFRHRASCKLGQAFRYSPENAFYIFNQQIYYIIWYLLDRASLI